MKTHLRVLQLDLDVMCENGTFNHDELYDYIVERLEYAGYDTVFLGVSCEGYWEPHPEGDVNKTSKYLMFNPGKYLGAKVLNADIAEDAINIIHDKFPTIRIMAWAPTIYSQFALDSADAASGTTWYRRASPFDPNTRIRLGQFFRALGRLSEHLDGVMFQDDMILLDEEDKSTSGLTAARRHQYVVGAASESEDEIAYRQYKVDMLDNLADHCFRSFQDGYHEAYPFTPKVLVCGRDYYEASVLYRDVYTNSWNGQSLLTGVQKYDQVVIMAYYNMCTGASDPNTKEALDWLKDLVTKTKALVSEDAMHKVIFKLQTVLWENVPAGRSNLIPTETLMAQKAAVLEAGGQCVGFYPAPDFHHKFDTVNNCMFVSV